MQKEYQALSEMLKEKDRQLSMVTSMFLQKEQELQSQIKMLQTKLEEAQTAVSLKEQIQIELPPQGGPVEDKDFHFDTRIVQEAEEAGSTEAPKPDEWAQLTQAKIEFSALITESLEPIQKECMHWEKRILHSVSICFPKAGDAIKAYNRPTLPYPLLKHEYLKIKESLQPMCIEEEVGGATTP